MARINALAGGLPTNPQPLHATHVGYELLGRCPRELVARGMPASPAELIALAHREGWLLRLEHAWRRSSIAAIASHRFPRDTLFFLNVDPRVLQDPGFRPGTTLGLLEQVGLSPHRIVFELTEAGAFDDLALAQATIAHYEAQGFHIALDDVGSGFASLQALVDLRPGIVKLDQEIVRGVSTDCFRRALVEGIVCFCRRARRALIAEGIESPEDLAVLMDLGVPFGQGYLLGRPSQRPGLAVCGVEPRSGELARRCAAPLDEAWACEGA